MNADFHYYATYCAAYLAGYSHGECMDICYSSQLVDLCSHTLLSKLKAPTAAATTQLQLELMEARTDIVGLQNITRIWASFHFLPRDLYSKPEKRCAKRYRNKYSLICGPNGELLEHTVKLAKGKSPQAAGIAMHVLADTWAHSNFAGTPSLVINNTNYYFYELLPDGSGFESAERKIAFRHSASAPDDLEKGLYTGSLYSYSENSIMNLGHGRAGHLPDYSFMKYKYLPAWGEYEEIIKDNPHDYTQAFCQMIYALKYLRGESAVFERGKYDYEAAAPYHGDIGRILNKRQLDSSDDWRALGERLSGQKIEPFDLEKYQNEYLEAPKEEKDKTFLGKFIIGALAQKSMVTNKIFSSGNRLAGYSIDYVKKGFGGIKAYKRMIEAGKEKANE